MKENERELLDGMRALAASEPREAPQRVEQLLLARFRARSKRRRAELWGSVGAGIAAVAAATALVFWLAPPRSQQAPADRAAVNPAGATQPAAEMQVENAVVRTDEIAASFYPLPVADELPPLETGMVVRVQLPMSSLRLMGLPVGEDPGETVQADVLLGQDGLARGVRLIQ
ncbi:MAG: hypothetical protein LAP38_26710 [Acidobacteriia bacterium]|nr:hypothetical protein [Terriglobia bacterium]